MPSMTLARPLESTLTIGASEPMSSDLPREWPRECERERVRLMSSMVCGFSQPRSQHTIVSASRRHVTRLRGKPATTNQVRTAKGSDSMRGE